MAKTIEEILSVSGDDAAALRGQVTDFLRQVRASIIATRAERAFQMALGQDVKAFDRKLAGLAAQFEHLEGELAALGPGGAD